MSMSNNIKTMLKRSTDHYSSGLARVVQGGSTSDSDESDQVAIHLTFVLKFQVAISQCLIFILNFSSLFDTYQNFDSLTESNCAKTFIFNFQIYLTDTSNNYFSRLLAAL